MSQGISIRKLLIIVAGFLVIGFVIPDDARGLESSFDQAVLVVREQRLAVPSTSSATSALISAPLQGFRPSFVAVPAAEIPICVFGCVMRC